MLGLEKAISGENLQSLALVVSAAFGGRKEKPKPVENMLEAELAFQSVIGG